MPKRKDSKLNIRTHSSWCLSTMQFCGRGQITRQATQTLTHILTYTPTYSTMLLGTLSDDGSSLGFSPHSPNQESHCLFSTTPRAQTKQFTSESLSQSSCSDYSGAQPLQCPPLSLSSSKLRFWPCFCITKELTKKFPRPQTLLLQRQILWPLLDDRMLCLCVFFSHITV